MGCSYSMVRFSVKNDQATYSHIQKGQFLQCEKQIQEKERTGQYNKSLNTRHEKPSFELLVSIV